MDTLPKHIGIIMDGNGRWATERKLPRTAGHSQGIRTAKKIIREAVRLGIPVVTLYVFSTENWKRAETEVGFLMKLIVSHLRDEFLFYSENSIQIRHSGDISGLPAQVQKEINEAILETRNNSALTVNLAINYGGRDEILRAVNKWIAASDFTRGSLDQKTLSKYLDNSDLADPDLIIRTAGEKRLSNFLLWESAYSEFYFSEKLWPDFTEADLINAVENFGSRQRKFGGIK